jgi:transcriptional regulator with XRE-family HTH domain
MHEAFAAEFGHVLREARQRKGLRQDAVAEALQLPLRVYSRMERGKLLPSITVLRELCVTLDVSADTLLSRAALRAETSAAARDEVYALLRALLTRLHALPGSQLPLLLAELRAGLATLEGA